MSRRDERISVACGSALDAINISVHDLPEIPIVLDTPLALLSNDALHVLAGFLNSHGKKSIPFNPPDFVPVLRLQAADISWMEERSSRRPAAERRRVSVVDEWVRKKVFGLHSEAPVYTKRLVVWERTHDDKVVFMLCDAMQYHVVPWMPGRLCTDTALNCAETVGAFLSVVTGTAWCVGDAAHWPGPKDLVPQTLPLVPDAMTVLNVIVHLLCATRPAMDMTGFRCAQKCSLFLRHLASVLTRARSSAEIDAVLCGAIQLPVVQHVDWWREEAGLKNFRKFKGLRYFHEAHANETPLPFLFDPPARNINIAAAVEPKLVRSGDFAIDPSNDVPDVHLQLVQTKKRVRVHISESADPDIYRLDKVVYSAEYEERRRAETQRYLQAKYRVEGTPTRFDFPKAVGAGGVYSDDQEPDADGPEEAAGMDETEAAGMDEPLSALVGLRTCDDVERRDAAVQAETPLFYPLQLCTAWAVAAKPQNKSNPPPSVWDFAPKWLQDILGGLHPADPADVSPDESWLHSLAYHTAPHGALYGATAFNQPKLTQQLMLTSDVDGFVAVLKSLQPLGHSVHWFVKPDTNPNVNTVLSKRFSLTFRGVPLLKYANLRVGQVYATYGVLDVVLLLTAYRGVAGPAVMTEADRAAVFLCLHEAIHDCDPSRMTGKAAAQLTVAASYTVATTATLNADLMSAFAVRLQKQGIVTASADVYFVLYVYNTGDAMGDAQIDPFGDDDTVLFGVDVSHEDVSASYIDVGVNIKVRGDTNYSVLYRQSFLSWLNNVVYKEVASTLKDVYPKWASGELADFDIRAEDPGMPTVAKQKFYAGDTHHYRVNGQTPFSNTSGEIAELLQKAFSLAEVPAEYSKRVDSLQESQHELLEDYRRRIQSMALSAHPARYEVTLANVGQKLKPIIRQLLTNISGLLGQGSRRLVNSMFVIVDSKAFYGAVWKVLQDMDSQMQDVQRLLFSPRHTDQSVLHQGREIRFSDLKVAFAVLYDLKRFLFHGNVAACVSRAAFRTNIIHTVMQQSGGAIWRFEDVCKPTSPFNLEHVLALVFTRTLRSTQRDLMGVEQPCELVMSVYGLVESMQRFDEEQILKWLHGPLTSVLVDILHHQLHALREYVQSKKRSPSVPLGEVRLTAAFMKDADLHQDTEDKRSHRELVEQCLPAISQSMDKVPRPEPEDPRFHHQWFTLLVLIKQRFPEIHPRRIHRHVINVAVLIGFPQTYPGPVEALPDLDCGTWCLAAKAWPQVQPEAPEAPVPAEHGGQTDSVVVTIGETTVDPYQAHGHVEICLSDKRQILEWRLAAVRQQHKVGPTNVNRIRAFIQSMWYNRSTSTDSICTHVRKHILRDLQLLDEVCFEAQRCHVWRMKPDEQIWDLVQPYVAREPALANLQS